MQMSLACCWISSLAFVCFSAALHQIFIRLYMRLIDESQCFQCTFEFPDYLIKNYTQHIAQVCWGYSAATLSLLGLGGNLIDFCAKTHWHADLINASRKCLSIMTYRQAQLAYLHSEQVTYHVCSQTQLIRTIPCMIDLFVRGNVMKMGGNTLISCELSVLRCCWNLDS